MIIIWRGLVTYIEQQLRQGKSVNIRKFGAFTFDIETDLPKIAKDVFEGRANQDLDSLRVERKHVHHLK